MLSTLRISRLHLYKYLFKHKYVNLSTGASDQNEKLLRGLEDDSNLKSHYDCIVIGAGIIYVYIHNHTQVYVCVWWVVNESAFKNLC